jgi:hypothetical protein
MKSIALALLLLSTTILPAAAQSDASSPPVAAPSTAGQGDSTGSQGTSIQNDTKPGVNGKHADGKDGCKARIEAICPGVQPGGGRIIACLKQNNRTMADVCPERARRMQEKQSQQGASGAQAPVAQPPAAQ